MTGFYGGDTDQMRQHGTACQQGAQTIDEITAAATAVIDAAPWFGPDAAAFRALWHGSIEPGLHLRADDIRGTGHEIDQHAEEQDRASGDGGDLIGIVRDLMERLPRIGRPMPEIVGPLPGAPLTPDVIRDLSDGVHDWFTGGDAEGGNDMYGSGKKWGKGQVAADERPIGHESVGDSFWDGREIDGRYGFLDVRADARASAGGHVTQDPFGNYTATGGGRAGAEVGLDGALTGPDGQPILSGDGRLGAEIYAEGGGSLGPDGVSGGGRAGVGAYGDISAEFTDAATGRSYEVGAEGYAGARAEANAYANATRNDDGQVNGFAWGARAEAFAGAEAKLTFREHSPGGWMSGGFEVGPQAGAGAGAGTGGEFSTDRVAFEVSGNLAWGGGASFKVDLGINPNEIVDTFTPGDYNLDDALSDASGALRDAGDWAAEKWPF